MKTIQLTMGFINLSCALALIIKNIEMPVETVFPQFIAFIICSFLGAFYINEYFKP